MRTLSAIDRPSIILDCDPGHDDVVAIAVAAATCDVAAVTTVAGNAPLVHCTRNALATVELLGLDTPVFAGADRPLVRRSQHAAAVHGDDGLGGVAVPEPTRSAESTTAVEAIIALTRAVEGTWLVPTGPLTNIAVALRADPGIADRVAGISLMGGGLARGNVTPAAEFNFWFDPDAAAVVFDSGIPIRMCGLDVTQQVLVDRAFAASIGERTTSVAQFFSAVFQAYADACEAISGRAVGALHDPCAVVALTNPDVFDFESLHVTVERRGGVTAGMSIADRRSIERGPQGAANTDVALGVRPDRVLEIVRNAITDQH